MNILLIIISVLLNCAAQLLIKQGMLLIGEVKMGTIFQSLIPMVTNIYLWMAMLCYAVSIFLWMAVLSRVDVSYAYPFLSIGYVVAAIVGYYFLGETVNLVRIVGIIVICAGVFLISRS
jgi:drug/metabolite transporter (DMT)-like permease